jgi:creatinine amidohydrolase
MHWGELRWPQVEALDKDTVVVAPLASVEQHGRHLPLLTDTMLVTEVAARAQAELGETALWLPPLWLGSAGHHMDFPGTLSLPVTVYSEVIKSLTRSILQAGFRRILYLCGHGGNEIPTSQALAELASESEEANAALLAVSCYWTLAGAALDPARHGMKQAALAHACEYETSMMLVTRPDLVAMGEAAAPPAAIDTRWWSSETGGLVNVFKRFRRLTDTGAMGLPAEATAQKGESLLAAVTAEVVRFVREFAAWPLL